MSYPKEVMADQTPEAEQRPHENPHRGFLIRRHLEMLQKLQSGEMTAEEVATNWADREIELEDRASHDPLTGLLNLQGFSDALMEELSVINLYGIPSYLGLFDGDKLKELNDRVGKLAGNQVIQIYADVLRQVEASRPHIPMLMGRFGGDEFMLLVIGAEIKEAREAFEEVRTTIPDALKRQLNMPNLESTISIGVVKVRPDDNANTLLQRADDQLKTAKTERNKVVFEDYPATLIHK